MKLVTFRRANSQQDRLGALVAGGAVLDLTAAVPEQAFASMVDFIEAGEIAWSRARSLIASTSVANCIAQGGYVLRAPIPRPPQFRDAMCFHKHIIQASITLIRAAAKASGNVAEIEAAQKLRADTYQLPAFYSTQPVYYKGNRFNVADPGEDIPWPKYSQLMDFELELACVIGKQCKDLTKDNALDHVFGFTIFNDFSARDAQRLEMEGRLGPAKGKDFDKANVFGPCIVTTDEIGDPQALRMIARVNGDVWCDGNSAEMFFKFGDLLAHISAGETLYPGEIIGSGTVGDGCGLEHDRYLKTGDVVELEIEKIGTLRNRVVRL